MNVGTASSAVAYLTLAAIPFTVKARFALSRFACINKIFFADTLGMCPTFPEDVNTEKILHTVPVHGLSSPLPSIHLTVHERVLFWSNYLFFLFCLANIVTFL